METTDVGGRPRIEIDYEMLEGLCRIHCTKEECADVLGCSEDTIDRRLNEETGEGFAAFYKKHSAGGRVSLRRAQMSAALDGNPTMLIWMGKQHLGQKEAQEVTLKPDAPFDGWVIDRAKSDTPKPD